MARLDRAPGDGPIADRIRRRRGGTLTELDWMLLHSPPMADGWNSMLGAVRTRSSLADRVRELVILRVAELNRAGFEWAAHEPLARRAGATDADIAALRSGGDGGALAPTDRAAIAYADAMTTDVAVPDGVFGALAPFYSPREIVELTVTVAAYNMVSRFLVALDIDADAWRGG